jgi:putative hydrolase of the HAD superfamily
VAEITTLFWDVGGVLLNNGWDPAERSRAVERFGLEPEEFEARHERLFDAFETGGIRLEEYLRQTVFYRPRPFSPDEVRRFVFGQSEARPDTLAIAEGLARARRYLMATLNNESLELNVYRIREFGLRDHFSAFYSSCFLGVRKPSAAIFQRALDLTQRDPGECIMIDDRAENLVEPARLGMCTIRFESAAQLREELSRRGVDYTPLQGA